MNEEPEGFHSLIVIKEGNLSFLADLMKWASEWAEEHEYESPRIRNTEDGFYEILAKPK